MVAILDAQPWGIWWISEMPDGALRRGLGLERFTIPGGCPTLSTLSAHAHASVVLGLRGTSATFNEVRAALRLTEVPDRLHEQPTRRYEAIHRFSLWLALADLSHAPVVVIEDPALHGSVVRSAGRMVREAATRHASVLLVTTSTMWADACHAERWPVEART